MVDEKWEEWEEHSVSEQIVLAKAGQTLGVFGLKYTLKKGFCCMSRKVEITWTAQGAST